MFKRLLISVLFCFFILSLVVLADDEPEKGSPIRFITYVYLGKTNLGYYEPADPTTGVEPGEFGPYASIYVPGNEEREALFLEMKTLLRLDWSGYESREAWCLIFFRCYSDVIPEDIEVCRALGKRINETNLAGNSGRVNYPFYFKFALLRNEIHKWRLDTN